MAVLSVGCVVSIDCKEDCLILRLDDGFLCTKTLIIKPPVDYGVKLGDCVVYTTDADGKRILHLGTINDVNVEVMTHLEIMKARKR